MNFVLHFVGQPGRRPRRGQGRSPLRHHLARANALASASFRIRTRPPEGPNLAITRRLAAEHRARCGPGRRGVGVAALLDDQNFVGMVTIGEILELDAILDRSEELS